VNDSAGGVVATRASPPFSWLLTKSTDEHGILLFAPTLHERRAKLATLLGGDAGRELELREAHRLSTEMGAVGHAERVGRELDL
jgi:hypothetical protein